MPRVTGGKRLGSYLHRQAKKARKTGREVGWEGTDLALRALRQEHGAEGADGQVTPATHFLRKAIKSAQPDISTAIRSGVATGNMEGGVQRAAEVLRSAIRESIGDENLVRSGKLQKGVKIRKARDV